jgi:hypothetical protein
VQADPAPSLAVHPAVHLVVPRAAKVVLRSKRLTERKTTRRNSMCVLRVMRFGFGLPACIEANPTVSTRTFALCQTAPQAPQSIAIEVSKIC